MPVPDGEEMPLWEANIEESTMLAYRCEVRVGLRQDTQVWFSYLLEELSSARRLRRCDNPVRPTLWENEETLLPPVHGELPRSIPLLGEDSLLGKGFSNMRLRPTKAGKTLQRVSRR